jgi:Protein of unknown function (DUF5818)
VTVNLARGGDAVVRLLLVLVVAVATLSAAGAPQTFTGVITDNECGDGNHAAMRMGDTDADCTKACADAHGASLVLHAATATYALTDQRAAHAFPGRKVIVVGTLDKSGKTIQVEKITAAK